MKIQFNQQTFGTRIFMTPVSREIIENSEVKNEIFKQLNNLKNNKINDYLFLDAGKSELEEKIINIAVDVITIIENKLYENISTGHTYIENKLKKSINSLYKSTKRLLIDIPNMTKEQLDESIRQNYLEI